MSKLLEYFLRVGPGPEAPPCPELVLACLRDPDAYPDVAEYLRAHPDYVVLLNDLPNEVAAATDEHLSVSAYMKFVGRNRTLGQDKADWHRSEDELAKQIQETAPEPSATTTVR